MQGEQCGDIRVVRQIVHIGDKGDVGQEVGQCDVGVLGGDHAQFLDVFPALLSFIGSVSDVCLVACVSDDAVQQIGRGLGGGGNPPAHHAMKCGHGGAGTAGEKRGMVPVFGNLLYHPPDGDPPGARDVFQKLDGLGTDAARRDIQDAQEAGRVGRRMDDPQKGQQVLDLPAGVEAGGVHQPVRDASMDKGLFQCAGLGIGSVHHCAVAEVDLACHGQTGNGVHNVLGFFFRVVGLVDDDFVPVPPVGERFLGSPVGVVANDGMGDVQNRLGGAVVLLQQVGDQVRKVFLHAGNVAVVGTSPAVDGLVLVANNEEVAMPGCQLFEKRVLGHVSVLKFVHQDVEVPLLVVSQDRRGFLEETCCFYEQIVKIQTVVSTQLLLVLLVHTQGDFF